MNIIPTTINQKQVPYTVVGGQKPKTGKERLSVVLLNRGGRIYRSSIFQELERNGFDSVISIEGPGEAYDVESLSGKFPQVRFLLLGEKATAGEIVNLGMQEAGGDLVFVLWSDLRFPSQAIPSRFFDWIVHADCLCISPTVLSAKGDFVPCVEVPAFSKKSALKILDLPPRRELSESLFPYDFIGVYSRERFLRLGGFDYNLTNPYWQKADFGFRAHLWGESIKVSINMRLAYEETHPEEDTTPDVSYKWFYLKNIAPKFQGDSGRLPYSRLPGYLSRAGENPFRSLAEFREARSWVETNKFRFKLDSRSVTDLWEMDGE